MKRVRLTVLFAAFAVMMIGVQAVQACEAVIIRYTTGGKYTCWNVSTTKTGDCVYSCSFTPQFWI